MQFHKSQPATPVLNFFLFTAIIAVCLISSTALCAAITWTGAGDGINWTDSDNWSSGKTPGVSDDVTIPTGNTVTAQLLYGDQTIKSLSCQGHLRVVEKPYHYYGISVTGQATVNQLTIEGNFISFAGDTVIDKLFLVSGDTGGSVSFSGDASLGTVDIQGGIFSYGSSRSAPPADISVNKLTISSGRISAGGWARKLIVNTLFEIKGAGEKIFSLPATSLVNKNQANWSGTGRIEFQGGFRNEAGATTTLEADLTFRPHNTAVYNAGTFQKAGGTGVTTLPGEFNNEGGTIDVQSGTLELAAETGTHQAGVPEGGVWNGGIVNVGIGAKLILVRDTYTWNGTVQGVINGHFLLGKAGSDYCTIATGAMGSVLNFSDSGLEIPQGGLQSNNADLGSPLVNRGIIRLVGNDIKLFEGEIYNEGQLVWLGDGILELRWGAKILNKIGALFTIEGNGLVRYSSFFGYDYETITNQAGGIIAKVSGGGTTTIGVLLNNQGGEVSVSSGTLKLTGGGISSGGTSAAPTIFRVSPGAMLTFGDHGYTNSNVLLFAGNAQGRGAIDIESFENDFTGELQLGADSPQVTLLAGGGLYNRGTLRAAGTLAGAQGGLNNYGRLEIGASPGSLSIAGNFTQGDEGTLNLELSGTAAGTQFDVLDVAGQCFLSGTLNVSRIYSFESEGDDQFLVLKCGSRSTQFGKNEFTMMNGLDLGGGKKLQPTWDPPGLPADRQAGLLLTTVETGFVVNTTGDESDADGSDGLCDVDLQKPELQCTLRAALEEVNRQSGKTYVTFAIPETDPQFDLTRGITMIRPASPLPEVTVPVSINGLSQAGIRPPVSPGIWLDGFSSSGAGLTITAGHSMVKGLIISRFSEDGLLLKESGGNIVSDCQIGTDGINRLGNAGSGVHLFNSGQNTITSCLLSANLMAGISIDGNNSTGNKVTKCIIGLGLLSTTLTGSGNAQAAGVLIRDASNNIIGGAVNDFNVIANNEQGVVIIGSTAASAATTSHNLISHNRIGTDALDSAELGNTQDGIFLSYAQSNIISNNVISGNGGNGVTVRGSDTIGNSFVDNLIGLTAAGDTALANQGDGLLVQDCPDGITIGDLNGQKGNVISGNKGNGIHVINGIDVLIAGNIIGTDSAGSKTFGNQGHGVLVEGVSQNVLVGVVDAGNIISGNGSYGVALVGSTVSNNTVQANLIGTDIQGGQAVENIIGGVLLKNVSQNVVGGITEAERNLISGNHFWGISIEGEAATGNYIQGNFIGTDRTGVRSLANGAGVRINSAPANVIGGNETGHGNLISGNTTIGVWINGAKAIGNKVQGNLIGTTASGDQPLPNKKGEGVKITGASGNLIGGTGGRYTRNIISGNGASGVLLGDAGAQNNTVQGNFIGTDLAGNAAVGNGQSGIIIEESANNLIGGSSKSLLGNIISGNKEYGILIQGVGATGNRLEANQIGTDYGGGNALPNARDGVFINEAPDNVIGGNTAEAANVISGNNGSGIFAKDSDRTRIMGNFIGTDISGKALLLGNKSNAGNGITFDGVHSARIGSSTPGAANVISGNLGHGILLTSTIRVLEKVTVQGNFIGVDSSGLRALGNHLDGVRLDEAATMNELGGNAAGEGNLVGSNGGNGFHISSTSNRLRGNIIKNNSSNGILLTGTAEHNTIGGDDTGSRNIINHNGTSTSRATGQGNGVLVSGGRYNWTVGNLISGNVGNGVYLSRNGWNYVDKNRIGTNEAGLSDDPNYGDGVRIEEARYCRVDKNIISGNQGCGVRLIGKHAKGNDITNNYIGADLNGDMAVPNQRDGIFLKDSLESEISENLISGNNGNGIHIAGLGGKGYGGPLGLVMYDSVSRFYNNVVGTKSNRKAALGNGGHGLFVEPAFVSVSMAGHNVFAYNGQDGVRIPTTTSFRLEQSSRIFNNGGLGIDIDGDGVTQNSPDDSVLDYPVITSAEYTVTPWFRDTTKFVHLIHVTGTAPKKAVLLIYANVAGDPSGFGEGRIVLGRIFSDDSGQFSTTLWTITDNNQLPATPLGELILTAVSKDFWISEFSPFVLAERLSDSDGDGIPDRDEDTGVNGGDANNDGLQDSTQSNVANIPLPNAQGSLPVATSVAWGITPMVPHSGVLPPLDGWGEPDSGGTLTWIPFELFARRQDGSTAPSTGSSLDVVVDLSNLPDGGNLSGTKSIRHTSSLTKYATSTLPPLVYWLYGPTTDNPDSHWYRFDYNGITGATFSGNNMTLHFIDGGRGDDDLTINGQIHYQGVLAADRTADFSLTGIVNSKNVRIGDTLTYILTIMNNGADDVPGVILADTLPGGIDHVSVSSTQGECISVPEGFTCALGMLTTGATAAVTIEIRSLSEGLLENTAQLTALAFDPVPTNNAVTIQSAVKLDLRDAILIFQFMCAIDTSGFDLLQDRNSDGIITMHDAIILLQEISSQAY